MTLFLLDTDTLSLLQRGHSVVLRHVNMHSATDIAISTVTVGEQLLGWHNTLLRARDHEQLASAHNQLASRLLPSWNLFAAFSFSEPAIVRFEHLKTLRLNIGSNDLRIASIALEAHLTVATRNLRDFSRVPGLAIVDWSV